MDRLDALTDLCEYLKNWFDDGCPVHVGEITIAEGTIQCSCDFSSYEVNLANGQYFRVAGSIFNDGVHCYPDYNMVDEAFNGTITPMRIPPAVLSMLEEIMAWRGKYEALDSVSMSPYQSESFAGYSYSKAGAGSNSGEGTGGWQSAFKNRLTHWRKI